VYLISWFL